MSSNRKWNKQEWDERNPDAALCRLPKKDQTTDPGRYLSANPLSAPVPALLLCQ